MIVKIKIFNIFFPKAITPFHMYIWGLGRAVHGMFIPRLPVGFLRLKYYTPKLHIFQYISRYFYKFAKANFNLGINSSIISSALLPSA